MEGENSKYSKALSSYKNYDDRNKSWKSSVEYKRLVEEKTKEYDSKLSKQNADLWKMYSNTEKKVDEYKNRQTKKHEEENKLDWKKISDSKKKDEKLIDL